MKATLLFLLTLSLFTVNAQLKTKVLKGKLGDSTLSYHANGKVSTIDFRSDANFRFNTFIAFDNKGKEIHKGEHGYRHGGAGLYPKYYENGQLSSVRETFQPDGGIQYYDVTSYYNEDGTFNRKEDYSLNTERETLMYVPQEPGTPSKKEEIKEEKKTSSIVAIDSTQLVIKNSTRKKVTIVVANKNTDEVFIYKVKRNQELAIGEFLSKKGDFNPKNYYVVNVVANDPKSANYAVVWIEKVSTIKKTVLMLIDISVVI
ncbi:MAG: hypothetical protein V4638_11310 [Bacteroidota bacterium]